MEKNISKTIYYHSIILLLTHLKGLQIFISVRKLSKYNMFYDKRSNTIRMILSKDFYTTDYISDAQSKQLVIHNGLSEANPYSYITIFDNSVVEEILDNNCSINCSINCNNNRDDFEIIIQLSRKKI